MEHKIIVVGIGPGSPDFILPSAKNYIDAAAVLVGSRRALQTFGRETAKCLPITGDLPAVMQFIKDESAGNDVVVMVSGDPGYYSLLAALRREFPPQALRVIPGITSVQLAFARLALPWQEARLLSLHGRQPKTQDFTYQKDAVLGLLTDTVYTSKTIAQLLLDNGWPAATAVYLCSRLSYEDEEIIATTVKDTAAQREFAHCVMVVTS